MLVYGADFFVLRPGLALLAAGLLLMAGSTLGPLRVGPISLSLYWSLAGFALGVVGLQSFCLGCITQVIYSYTPGSRSRWLRLFEYTRAMVVSAGMALTGAGLTTPLIREYVSLGYRLPGTGGPESRMAVCGLFLIVAGFTVGHATLVVHAAALASRNRYFR